MMTAFRIIGVLCFVLAAGCAGVKETPPGAMGQTKPLFVDPSLLGPNQGGTAAAALPRAEAKEAAAIVPAPPVEESREPVTTGAMGVRSEPEVITPAPTVSSPSPAKAAPPSAKAPVKVSAIAAPIEQPRKNDDPPAVAKTVEPPLDVAALKARLRDTNAIGVFTKLALKNQVDDLLKKFRAHYGSGQTTGVTALRQPYDMLVLKVLALVQDNDPSLARTIVGSREAIWGILADRDKFNSVT